MEVLISGAGIAGPNLAWWLSQGGHRVTMLEKAPEPRRSGYIIDFWGKGYDLAERMGLMPRLQQVGYHVEQVRFLGKGGKETGGFAAQVFTRATGGRYISLPRGELSLALYESVADRAEVLLGTEIEKFEQDAGGVDVRLTNGSERRFDLVVGAEGIHSRTRDLAFGPKERFERFLGYTFAAFTAETYGRRAVDTYVMYGEPGRQAARFALRDGASLVLLIWRDDEREPIPHGDEVAKRALLRERYSGAGWEVPDFLAALDTADDLYIDRVSQIRMDSWHKGPVALVGDAAYAPSFLAGQGAALAMIGGYVLAGELKRSGGALEPALAAYEQRLAPFMRSKQDAALGLASSFVPRTEFGLKARDIATRLLGIGWIADLLVGRSLRDQVELPDYF
ncbi:FAD-binding domain [Altererythrobacter salegens]|uniref:FAD-binding domain n=1 Tax=Croceibacterium salegens TaxID=1737568 RepID=A0A6I4SUG6_9SPHN|nr:FAD-binding domain [Croceibacterium salegens]MXO59605.1 FAD-binding domain [Croceibacterium salegens]